MFFLLLFFLIISTLANPNVIDLALPKAENNNTTDKAHVSLSVTKEKEFYLDKQQLNFDDIEGALAARVAETGDKTVIVRLPKDLEVQDMVNILQIGVKLKLKFVIATTK
jgi:biopolymer transport protein ExbD